MRNTITEQEVREYAAGYQPLNNFVDIDKIVEVAPTLLLQYYDTILPTWLDMIRLNIITN